MAANFKPGQGQFRSRRDPGIRTSMAKVVQNYGSAVTVQIAAAITNGISQAYEDEILEKFNILASDTGFRKYQLEANEEIAGLMVSAVLGAYDDERELHESERAAPPDYRKGSGRIGGSALREALSGKAVAVGTYEGVGFINQPLLNEAAAFWRRLAFGSGGGKRSLPPIAYTLFGVHFAGRPASLSRGAPVFLPAGAWFSGGKVTGWDRHAPSEDEFAPIKQRGDYFVKANHEITAWGFLDAGIHAFNTEAGRIYERMVAKILADKKAKI